MGFRSIDCRINQSNQIRSYYRKDGPSVGTPKVVRLARVNRVKNNYGEKNVTLKSFTTMYVPLFNSFQ